VRLTLLRTYKGSDCTMGVMTVADIDSNTVLTLQTMEKPWLPHPKYKGGSKGVSCVPVGEYRLECHNSEAHPRTWALVNPLLGVVHWPAEASEGDRTVVLIHTANYASELRGCIAPGMKTHVDAIRGVRMVTNSRQAMKLLQEKLTWSDDHILEIR
jgi:hypothetical protein